MRSKTLMCALLGSLTLVGFAATAEAEGTGYGRAPAPAPLEGTWVVTVRPIFCSGPNAGTDVPGITPVVSQLTFGRGGSLVEASSNPAFGAGKRSAGLGAWQRTGRTSYQYLMQAFLVEPNAPYRTGLQRIEQTVELHADDLWTSSGPVQFFETFDLSTAPGLVPYRAGCARAEAERMY